MGVKCEKDKFYTKREVVKNLLKYINFSKYDLIIEPSAGDGSFSDLIRSAGIKILSLDISPESENIIQQDWFEYQVPFEMNKVLIIGNPPFGVNNNLSKAFIKHAISFYNVKTIAFILPDVFNKHTNQSIFNKDVWKLARVIKVPNNAFLLNGNEYHVPCSFYIWTREKITQDLRFDFRNYLDHGDFSIVKENEYPDFYVMGANPSVVKELNDVKPNNRGYYIKAKIDQSEVRMNFRNINWSLNGNSSASGGVSWFSLPEMIFVYDTNKQI